MTAVLEQIRKLQDVAIMAARSGLSQEELLEFEQLLPSSAGPARRFERSKIEQFVIGRDGLRFYFFYRFPKPYEALTPLAEYFLSYETLRPYLAPQGKLGFMLQRSP